MRSCIVVATFCFVAGCGSLVGVESAAPDDPSASAAPAGSGKPVSPPPDASAVDMSCSPEPSSTTCAGKCKSVTNNCGTVVECGATCADQSLCDGAGTCTCPTTDVAIVEYKTTNGFHCYGASAAQCPDATETGNVLHLYASALDGLEPVYLCAPMNAAETGYLFALSPDCETNALFRAPGVLLGYGASTTACKGLATHRYYNQNDIVVRVTDKPSPPSGYLTDVGFEGRIFVW